MTNIFLLKSYARYCGETIPRPYSHGQRHNRPYLWINSLKIQFIFIVSQVQDYRNLLKLSCRPLAFTSYKAFLKNKEV